MKPVIIAMAVFALLVAIVATYSFVRMLMARRRFIKSVTGPDLGCETGAKFQTMFEVITTRSNDPHLIIACKETDVVVPQAKIIGRTMTLDISFRAVERLHWDGHELVFRARFGAETTAIRVPIRSIVALYSAKSGQGVVFRESWVDQSTYFEA